MIMLEKVFLLVSGVWEYACIERVLRAALVRKKTHKIDVISRKISLLKR